MKYNPNIQPVLEKYLSKSRLSKYSKILDSDDFEKKLELYLFNIRCAERFHSILIQLEVILRNAINEQLILDFGSKWFCDEKLQFAPTQKQIIAKIILDLQQASKKIDACNVTANLTFGFWVNLFNSEYDQTFWRKSLHKIFSNHQHISRSTVRERLEKFRNIRNRISHCEPIVQFPLVKYYGQLIEFISWLNKDLAIWIAAQINFKND